MARPVSWLPRLREIRRSVAGSVRSHYQRKEIEQLFELQPRAASRLLEILPTVKVGTGYMVERDALGVFLDRVQEAEDVPALLDTIRAEKAGTSRRKIRHLVQRDYDPMNVFGIPNAMKLKRGRIEIDFATVEDLSSTLVTLARVLEDDLDEFVRLYEPPKPQDGVDNSAAEVSALFRELEELEAAANA